VETILLIVSQTLSHSVIINTNRYYDYDIFIDFNSEGHSVTDLDTQSAFKFQ
jgi:hypothetical protein